MYKLFDMHPAKYVITMLVMGILIFLISSAMPVQEKFKNLKILPKNISEAALDKVMVDFQNALGVDCAYCHSNKTVTGEMDYASDKKPEKEIARKMMTMTTYINKHFFSFNGEKGELQAVTCQTCHNGSPIPGMKFEEDK